MNWPRTSIVLYWPSRYGVPRSWHRKGSRHSKLSHVQLNFTSIQSPRLHICTHSISWVTWKSFGITGDLWVKCGEIHQNPHVIQCNDERQQTFQYSGHCGKNCSSTKYSISAQLLHTLFYVTRSSEWTSFCGDVSPAVYYNLNWVLLPKRHVGITSNTTPLWG